MLPLESHIKRGILYIKEEEMFSNVIILHSLQHLLNKVTRGIIAPVRSGRAIATVW